MNNETKPNQVGEPDNRSKKKGKDKPKPKQTKSHQAKPETVAGVLKQALNNRSNSKQGRPVKLSKGDVLKSYYEIKRIRARPNKSFICT